MIPCPPLRWVRVVLPVAFLATTLGCPSDDGPSEDMIRRNVLGTAYLGQQKWIDAGTEFREAARLDPGDPIPWNNAAVALLQQGKDEEAEALLERALEADPSLPHALYNLGLVEKNRGRFAEAAARFEAVAAQDPDDLLTRYNLGIAYSRTGRHEEALAAYRAALALDPTHVSTLYGLGRLLLQRGDPDEGARLVALSQQIRARSGLDEAVGSQYGEQGPYALGIDYPGDALAAPTPIEVRFVETSSNDAGCGNLDRTGSPGALTAVDGRPLFLSIDPAEETLRGLGLDGPTDPLGAAPVSGRIVALVAGVVAAEGSVTVVGALLAQQGLQFVVLGPQDAWDTAAFLPSAPWALPEPLNGIDITLVDRDHDGDLDLFGCWNAGRDPVTAGCVFGTNDGSGRFELTPSSHHGFELTPGAAGSVVVAFSDVDNDRDVDLLVGGPAGVRLLTNQRDGTFEDVSTAAGLGDVGPSDRSMEVADLNKDGFMDLLVGSDDDVRFLRNLRGRFDVAPLGGIVDSIRGPVRVADYDNDGFLDVVATTDEGVRVYRNLGRGQWALDATAVRTDPGLVVVAVLDADLDGDVDLLAASASECIALRNEGGNANRWVAITSRGVGDNALGIGAKVEVLAGALRQKFEVRNPLPLHAGLGSRETVESIRYLWPSGVLQDEVGLAANHRVDVTQLDRKGTSCPLLYAWGRDGWRFVTDFLGGCAVGYLHGPGVYSVPDTDEYVSLVGGVETDEGGRFRVRLNNQLEEVIWFDKAELIVVDHPLGTEIYPNERLMPGPPWPEFELFASADIRPIAAARGIDDDSDQTDSLRRLDRGYVDNFELLRFKGYAEPHTLELDLGPFPSATRIVLLLDGWIDYADSSANLAASQAGRSLSPPRLSIADGRGGWLDPPPLMGFPAGLPKTMAVELSGLFPSGDHRIRLETNMRIYWDRARIMVGGAETALRVQRLQPTSAVLRFGGFPAPLRGEPGAPAAYDPTTVEPRGGWMAHVGRYTAWGDVRELLLNVDDRFVTTKGGDEIELSFESPGPTPAGFERSFLLFADGFGKDMDPNSAANGEVGPIPFHAMPRYPYPERVIRPPVAAGDSRWVQPSALGLPGALPQPLAARPE